MAIDGQGEMLGGFASWAQVAAALEQDWVEVRDARQGLHLARVGDELHLLEDTGHLRAEQRDVLHRLGFRRLPGPHVTLWQWDVQPVLRGVDLVDFSSPLERLFERGDPFVGRASIAVLRTTLARERLLSEQAERVLRNVFGSAPQDLAVAVIGDDVVDADWDDDGWARELPAG